MSLPFSDEIKFRTARFQSRTIDAETITDDDGSNKELNLSVFQVECPIFRKSA